MGRSYWLLLALAACGDDSNRKIADAPPGGQHDAPIDSPATNSPVTVLVEDDTGPTQGAHVYFQASDSTVISATATDTAGTASALMPMGGYVTVVALAPGGKLGGPTTRYQLSTWAGVKPGDHLVLSDRGRFVSTVATTTLILPDDPNHVVASYEVHTSCGDANFSVGTGSAVVATTTGQIFMSCLTADVLVVATDVNGQPVSSFYVAAQAFTDAGTVDYSAKTFTNAATRNYQFTNNTDVVDIQVNDVLSTQLGFLYSAPSISLTGNPASGSAVVPASPAGVLDVVSASQYMGSTQRLLGEWGTTGDYTQDWAAHLLPDFAGDPTFDAGTHALVWTTTGGAVTANVAMTQTFGFANSVQWNWDEYGPGGTSLAFPVLPTDIADFNYDHLPTVNSIQTFAVPGGYDAVRAAVFAANGPQPTGASGVSSGNVYIPISGLAATTHAPKKRDVMRRWIHR